MGNVCASELPKLQLAKMRKERVSKPSVWVALGWGQEEFRSTQVAAWHLPQSAKGREKLLIHASGQV